ncbi:similar to Saccharomyces cerevisiae YMR235C RNA1 GTPase activating protein (GAP) for Gsp1p, involved in nuclear transport [Maudiozyma barnettii]|uniref:Similar to Saccharomyces cerevisiae YMR235C RNA1 GTPase activating protein (GAP) for Gsp1p, involved in nuclear transport n=1 Tax=Maudiozyma barnettii TaxID=61262 RepID=A0A8H2VCA5_9SACH|nr:GTPase-activating protein RNA1 [Kazachstania barnettii]CAB4252667.1 similar to Saccharomyces cerevisiae YMR235C RNA1 GTPase activating protein (GAP) for Gsp1p, involved in nuclear transport [Kazachstania barnettii]CAD1780457.1 similar to Saccharomyces cerevisiae YMR235C RNA1 GTPase activating protein (GAP) for Gsp1p, involved in nuclear transport [Kazachstania barnettii]
MATLSFIPVYPEENCFSIASQALKLTTEEDITPHLDAILKISAVNKIDLSGNTLGIDASKALAKLIASNESIYNNLKEVNFADLYTSRLVDEVVESLNVLLPAFLKCPKLTIVNLSDNAFGLRTIDSLESYISNATALEHLILSNNGMGPFAGERIGKALFHLAKNKLKLTPPAPLLSTFICGRNRLENGSSLYLALGLKAHAAGLKTVKLYQNGIRPRGIMNLIHYGFKYNTHLEVLDLQDNTLTKTASLMLAENLPIWKDVLVELNLNDCLLKKDGADAIMDVFTKLTFPHLKALKLEFNEIVQSTIEEKLLKALESKKLPELKVLQINGNVLEEDSEALDTLQGMFDDLELDDLEELDSDEEESDEEDDENETFQSVETDLLEKDLSQLEIDSLIADLAKASI